jgi:hypothetical protein
LEADHDSAVFVKMIKSYSAAMKEAADLSVKPADVETD